ncbi:MAG: SseB family protein [Lachnospiraceae bacterium]|nr:SseB family protein [Lachnospiraceae bacterium]
MTKEERTIHANDISDRYVPRISPDDTDIMAEIKELSIQDIITIYSNACYALEKGMFAGVNMDALNAGEPHAKRYADAIEHVKNIAIEKLKTADMLWTVIDKITRSPFIDDINHVWIFTEKELADECVDYYMQQYRTTFEVTEIKKDDIVKFFGQTAYMKGAEYFLVDMGGYAEIKLKSEWIVEKPDFSNTPYINRPVMNPDYFRAVAKFKEEYYYRANYEGKKEKLRRFEDDMIKAFHDARFLVPVKGMEQIKKNLEGKDENGEGTLTKETEIYIPSVSKGEGENVSLATPIFTDWEEFNKAYSQDEWGGWIWTASDLLSAPADIVCLNVGSLCFEMSKNMIKQLLDIWNNQEL